MSGAQRLSPSTRAAVLRMAAHGGSVRIAMKGRSMLPDLREGMTLSVSRRAPRVGDVAVFRVDERLFAHRVIALCDDVVTCAGDAQPECLERVALEQVVGVVTAVFDARQRRVDGALYRLRGTLRARLRRLRVFWRLTAPARRPRTYRALLHTLTAAVQGDHETLVTACGSQPASALAAMAHRHRCGAALCAFLERLSDNGDACAVRSYLRRDRWRASLKHTSFRAQVLDVLQTLHAAGVRAVALKGAHRALCDLQEAHVFDSVDIDVLVPSDDVERACSVLRSAHYRQEDAPFYHDHHHAAPLWRQQGLPVEVHRALQRAALNLPNDFEALRPYIKAITVEQTPLLVLDQTATALHLAVHCLQRPALRELVLLAQQLRRMNDDERDRLRNMLASERDLAIPIGAAVRLAACIAGVQWTAEEAASRYAEWMVVREDLPRPLRARTACVDAWLCARERRFMHVLAASFADRRGGALVRAARALGYLAAGAIIPPYARFMR